MSRYIDLSEPLSDDDREYLISRSRLDDIRRNDAEFGDAPEFKRIENSGDVDSFKVDDGSDLLSGGHPDEKPTTNVMAVEAGLNPENAQSEPTVQADDQANPNGLGEQDDDADNYDDEKAWSYADLQQEAKDREPALSAAGSRAELIARLREDDASSEPTDED